jgi:hypothetical protein
MGLALVIVAVRRAASASEPVNLPLRVIVVSPAEL